MSDMEEPFQKRKKNRVRLSDDDGKHVGTFLAVHTLNL